ncbi:Phosphocarrier protein HPr /dihydroxyacetone kinase DhaM subunit [Microbacterium sp. ru370.1]|uniref:dihydroxyacetone kinase phosphoryl donor subunit DhaM n=1 Tax=unclassified Microbacterium TaxID=2609290 RepID=UPI0008842CE3|nr:MULTISPECIES: dihydroxyacetone kinase phosphoryl donor subunit DhaM [unclassified Microbacterium]SDO56519.1 Phosphocarrier protein HPr /dihydroxyacetone kinase DhaM subunit [Microbacterium sp. ru370.1]SIT85272.1 PTS hybrid protein [Microbacterium sp. RU1D]
MIGIVAVSHSRALAEAAMELALQMGGAEPPVVRVAAGGPDDDLGTDAVAIAAAMDEADSGDGVLVLMDLGSAILSAETALEFAAVPEHVRLSPAPFVEGLVAAVVTAAGGAGLDEVAAEVAGAGEAKRRQLGSTADGAQQPARPASAPDDEPAAQAFETVVVNPSGLHARPAATFVKAASRYDADVRIVDLDAGSDEVSGRSLLALMALGVRRGSRVRVSATGPQAAQALDELRTLIDDGFGEH